MKNMKKILLALSLIAIFNLLFGCASIVSGVHQSVSVDTGHVTGAICSLENDKGKWYVNQTPVSVMVHRSSKDLLITCEKKGYGITTQKFTSKTKALVWGNLIFFPFYIIIGPIIGASTDIVDGAAYDYPTNMSLAMKR